PLGGKKRHPTWDEKDWPRDQRAHYGMIFRSHSVEVRLDTSFVTSRRTTAYSPWNHGSSRWIESMLTIADRCTRRKRSLSSRSSKFLSVSRRRCSWPPAWIFT